MELKLTSKQIWLCNQFVDFRKSIDGLSAIVASQFKTKPTEGIYVFLNRNKNRLKILAWHGNGFILLYKRLERGLFKLPTSDKALSAMDEKQLSWLLAGLDWEAMTEWKTLEYKSFY